MTTLELNLGARSYGIMVGAGLLANAGELLGIKRRAFILTDSGVPKQYAEAVAASLDDAIIYTVAEGEGSKSLATLENVLTAMAEFGMTRADAMIAVGGGVVGDLAGFAAACYMRGIDFYNVPTTLLAQLDSSIGGKTAVNLGGIKNVVGAFHQPRGVLIDTDCLKTLDERFIACGLAEAVKMAMTSDKELFESFEKYTLIDIMANIEDIIVRSLKIKKQVVEADEREGGLRKILNFGHTFGHGVEAEDGIGSLYHGECVAIGMIPMCAPEARARLVPVLKKLGLPTEYHGDIERALEFAMHDKKSTASGVDAVYVPEVGSFEIKAMSHSDLSAIVREGFCI